MSESEQFFDFRPGGKNPPGDLSRETAPQLAVLSAMQLSILHA